MLWNCCHLPSNSNDELVPAVTTGPNILRMSTISLYQCLLIDRLVKCAVSFDKLAENDID